MKTFQTMFKLGIKWEKKTNLGQKKKKVKREVEHEKTASFPYQDLHPNWDRFRGTMLYPLSCGELAMKGEQI